MHSINYYMTVPPAWMRRAPSFHSTSAVLYSLYLLLSILSKCSVSCPGQFMSSWKANIVFIIYILSVLRDSFGQIAADTYYFWGGVKRRNGWVDGWCLKRKCNPLQYSYLENPMGRGAWWAAVHGVAKSRAQLSD